MTRASVCRQCGSQVEYAPGTTHTRCVSCGAEATIGDAADNEIEEHSFDEWLASHEDVKVATLGGQVATCQGCGAQLESTDLTNACQFCGGHLTVLDHPVGVVPPEAVVPFSVDRTGARTAFRGWLSSLWFAPNELKKVGSTESLAGTYVPHWTFDAGTRTVYSGQRGDYYYVIQTRMVSDGKGGMKSETYQERRTRWSHASGRVARDFDDVVVPASQRVAVDKIDQMGPWSLSDAVPFQPEYLSGYSALRYDVDPADGATNARGKMEQVIDSDVRRDIGGDEQQVSSMDVAYSAVMFKLVLLPLWIATYLYGGKTWQVLVNANTGEVAGDRPWSKVKIAAAILGGILAAVLAYFVFTMVSADDTAVVDDYGQASQTVPVQERPELRVVPDAGPPEGAGALARVRLVAA